MLSISKMGQGAEGYYLRLAREDYYSSGEEPPGIWHGRGAASLGLLGLVVPDDLRAVVGGFSPTGRRPLVQSAGRANHQSGWDLTFSAPKSVSVLWGLGDERTRAAVEECHRIAVLEALRYFEDEALVTRRGHGGSALESADGVFAVFEHGTSRLQDPQLHSHALMLNIGGRSDGTFGSVQSKPAYEHKMALGALYRAALASGLQRAMSLQVERNGDSFHVTGVSRPLCKEFSKRRSEVFGDLEDRGAHGPAEAERSALATRRRKRNSPREELREKWKATGFDHGYVEPKKTEHSHASEKECATHLKNHAERSVAKRLAEEGTFRKADLLRDVAQAAIGTGGGAWEVRSAIDDALRSEILVPLGEGHRRTFASRELVQEERDIFNRVLESRQEKGLPCSSPSVSATLTKHGFFRQEKADALRHITEEEGAIKTLTGVAGSGKTSLLEAAKEVWQANGYEVIGAAVTGKAARELTRGAGIPSRTVKGLLDGLGASIFDMAAHHAKQIWREARGRKGYKLELPKLHDRTILVIDEASMVNTRQMGGILKHAKQSGAKVVLVGDEGQAPPIEGPSPFGGMVGLLGGAGLSHVIRQKEDWARQAVQDASAGEGRKAMKAYDERGLLMVDRDSEKVKAKLVEDFLSAPKGMSSLILANTNEVANDLNRRVQKARQDSGELGVAAVYGASGDALLSGDRVLFRQNSKMYGVDNGTLGTVIGVDEDANAFTARLDEGRKVTIPLSRYGGVSLGYAVTTYKAQGATVDHAFVYASDGRSSQELAYVQLSRARTETRLYAGVSPERWEQKLREMEQPSRKAMALEFSGELAQETGIDL